jgi:DNA-binding beta-propeller fold protein YncE
MDLMEVVTGPPGGLGLSKTDIQFSEDPYAFTGTVGASAVRPNSRHIYSTGLVSGASSWVLRMFELVATPVSFDRVDASTAAGHQDFPLPTGSAPHDTIVEPLGRYLLNLEVASPGNSDNLAVYELDWTTGLPTRRNAATTPSVVLHHTTGPNPLHIVPDPRGRFLYVPNGNGIAGFRFTRNPTGPALEAIDNDPATGGLQQAVPMGGSSRVVIDPTGQWLYSPGSLGTEAFAIDPATGTLTSAGIASPDELVDLQVLGNL